MRLAAFFLLVLWCGAAHAQQGAIIQNGAAPAGHIPMYIGKGGGYQVKDSGISALGTVSVPPTPNAVVTDGGMPQANHAAIFNGSGNQVSTPGLPVNVTCTPSSIPETSGSSVLDISCIPTIPLSDLAQGGAVGGQVLGWSGSWQPMNLPSGSGGVVQTCGTTDSLAIYPTGGTAVVGCLGVTGASGQVLVSNGAGTAPTWQSYLSPLSGAVARTYSARLTDITSFLDFGSSDNAAQLSTALTAAAGGVVLIPQGSFTLGSTVTTTNSAVMMLGNDFTDPTNLPGFATCCGVAARWHIGEILNDTTPSVTEALLNIGLDNKGATPSAPGYEHAALLIGASNYVPETATQFTLTTPIQTYGRAETNNGAVAAGVFSAVTDTGISSFMEGEEIDLFNNGAAATTNGATNSHYGLQIISAGPNPDTTALNISGCAAGVSGCFGNTYFSNGITFSAGAMQTNNPANMALLIPNHTSIASWNAAGTGYLEMAFVDNFNQLVLGNGIAATFIGGVLVVNGTSISVNGQTGVNCSAGSLNPATAVVTGGAVTHC